MKLICRWLHQANPKLSALITNVIGSESWLKDLSKLSKLKAVAEDPAFQKQWMQIKYENKVSPAPLLLIC